MTDTPPLPAPSPPVSIETQPFWDATRQGRLMLPRCDQCGYFIWYPRRFCPVCGSREVSWIEAEGTGSVYSFTIISKGSASYRESGPFVFAVVELTEGPRMMTNIVGIEPDRVSVGMAVRVVFHPTSDGIALPRFEPVESA